MSKKEVYSSARQAGSVVLSVTETLGSIEAIKAFQLASSDTPELGTNMREEMLVVRHHHQATTVAR